MIAQIGPSWRSGVPALRDDTKPGADAFFRKGERHDLENRLPRLGRWRRAASYAFWQQALDYVPLRQPSEDWAILVPRDGIGQQMAITIVSSDAADHQRHHLDLYASDREREVERLLQLGATRVDWRYPDGADYIVLADPDGNRFCVIEK